MNFSLHYMPYLPAPRLNVQAAFLEHVNRSFGSSRSRVVAISGWSDEEEKRLAKQIWYQGASVLATFSALKHIPQAILWPAIVSGFVPLILSAIRARQLQAAELFFLLSVLVLMAEMAFSAVIYAFRPKELLLCQPLIFSSLALSATLWIKTLRAIPRLKRK
jgi:hypothetical protein